MADVRVVDAMGVDAMGAVASGRSLTRPSKSGNVNVCGRAW